MDFLIEKEISKSGHDIVKVNSLYLHSKYNPIREAEVFLKEEYKPHHLHIVFGYGYGYVVDNLIKKCQFNEPVLVLDPLVDVGQFQINHSYGRLYYADLKDKSKVIDYIDQLSSYSTNVHVIVSMNYNKLFPTEFKAVLEYVKNNHYKQGSNLATAKHYAFAWQKNLLLNTQSIKDDYSLNILKDLYSAPIVIASGGPSLIKQLNLLKQYRDQIILICAGSTINALISNGIYPDYVVSVDGGEPNFKHFKDLKFNQSVGLIYGPTNHYKVRYSFDGPCYTFIPSVKPQYKEYFKDRFNKELPLIDGGGSVAHYALSIAKYISKGPIALIGQDLALTNNQSHADGVKGNKSIEQLPENSRFYVEGYYGDTVVTTQTLNIMLNSFNEPPLSNISRENLWNCTEGGAKIKSIEQIEFKEFLYNNVDHKVEKIVNNSSGNKSIATINNFIDNELKNYTEILKLLNKGIKLIQNSLGIRLNKYELDQLGKIEKELNKLYKKYCIETLLEPVLDRCSQQYLPTVGETQSEASIRAKNYALDLYITCSEQISLFIEQLKIEEL